MAENPSGRAPVPATSAVLQDLIAALAVPGAINSGLAAHVTAELVSLLEQERSRQRLLALDAREVASRGVPGDAPPLPPAAL